MTRSHRRHLVVLSTGAALAVSAGLLGGCSTGQLTTTSKEVAAVPGGWGDVLVPAPPGQSNAPDQRISIRNATVDYTSGGVYQPGQTAPLTLWIINGTGAPVILTGVTGVTDGRVRSCTRAVTLPATATPASPTAPASPAVPSSPVAPSDSATPSVPASPGSTSSPSPSPSATAPANNAPISISIPPERPIKLATGSDNGCLQLTDLTHPVRAGKTVGLIFTFLAKQDGHTYTIGTPQDPFEVPFGIPTSAAPRISVSVGSPKPID